MKKTTTGFSKYSAAIAICSGIVLSLSILTFSDRVTTPNRNNPYFNYGAGENRNAIIQVMDNNRVEVPVVFTIDPGVKEVSLEFSGDHKMMPGLTMTEKAVKVIEGKAVTTLIIQFNDKPSLKAGTHFLAIVARDSSTGKIIREGDIHFTYNMHEVIGKCQC
jgi:hypothetical protein